MNKGIKKCNLDRPGSAAAGHPHQCQHRQKRGKKKLMDENRRAPLGQIRKEAMTVDSSAVQKVHSGCSSLLQANLNGGSIASDRLTDQCFGVHFCFFSYQSAIIAPQMTNWISARIRFVQKVETQCAAIGNEPNSNCLYFSLLFSLCWAAG